jgi:type IV pilus biogenesis protein PilP
MPPTGAARSGAGPNVQFQAPPPATTTLERPATPPAAELDMMSRLQADIARLRLELEKARLEREIAQQRQPPPTATPAAASTPAAPVRPAAAPPPPPAAMPRPDPAAADRRALPQVIEIRGAAGTFVAVVQNQSGQRLTLRAGDDLPNSPLKVQSIEPWQVNFVSQEGNRGPYPVPVSPPGTTAPAAGVTQGPVVRPITDAGLATPIVR